MIYFAAIFLLFAIVIMGRFDENLKPDKPVVVSKRNQSNISDTGIKEDGPSSSEESTSSSEG